MLAKLLVIDGSPSAAQDAVVAQGGQRSGQNYANVLQDQAANIGLQTECFILQAADGEQLPQGMTLTDFHGIAWTGSPLSAYDTLPAVRSQIDLARAAFESGVPCFGSCWGLQVMAVALGGEVKLNPKGYEIGIARQVTLNDAGRQHPMFRSKGPVFDAICTHQDEVVRLPDGAQLLASNDMSDVQAAEVTAGDRSFWGVQYHPEYDLKQIAAIMRRRAARLADDGFAQSPEAIQSFAADLVQLQEKPTRRDLAWRYGIGRDIMDGTRHGREIANWLEIKIVPRLG